MAAACMTFLTYLLLSQDPWWMFRVFPKEVARTLKHGVVDKVYHLVAYFGATCVLMWYAAAGTRRTFYGMAAGITVHAIGTEFLQQFVPRRTTDLDDLIADFVGIAAGVVAGILVRRTLKSKLADSVIVQNAIQPEPAAAKPVLRRGAEMVPGVIPRRMAVPMASRAESDVRSLPVAVSATRTSFERLQLSSEQIAEVQPRQINYRLLGIVAGVSGLMLASTYAVHGWQVRRVSGSLLQQARTAVASGRPAEARQYFEQYCNASPSDVNALAEFAILSDDLRERPRGGKGVFMLFERVLRKDQTRDDIRRRIVITAIELGRYSDALSHVKVLRQTHPKDGLFDYQAGICHEKLSDFKLAAEAFQAAIDDTPELVEPWEHLAWLLHSELGKVTEAEELMARLVQVNSQNADAWVARAKLNLRTQQFDAAGDDMSRALQLEPNAFRVLHAAGEVGIARARQARSEDRQPYSRRIAIEAETLLNRNDQPSELQRKLDLQRIILEAEFGRVERAFELASRQLEDNASEDETRIHELMAEIAVEHGDAQRATLSLNQLPRTEITDGQRLRVKAGVAMSEQRWEDAVEVLQAARSILAESPTHLQKVDLTLATCFGQLRKTDEQLLAYRRVLKYSPQSIAARRGLASTLATARRYPEALAEYRQLVHIPAVRLELARHLINYNRQLPEVARDWNEVLELLAAAEADGDSSVEWTVLKAEVLMSQRDFQEARRLVVQSARENPNNSELRAMQIQIAERSGDLAEATRLKGTLLADAGQADEAERQLRMTLLDSQQNAEAAISLMQFYLQQGQTDQAVDVFKKHAPAMLPVDLSRTYEVFGDVQRAVGVLEDAVRTRPEDAVVLQKLSELLIRCKREEQAEPLLERLISLASGVTAEQRREARRRLAVLLAEKQSYRAFQKATSLMDQNAAETTSVETSDLRCMAMVLQHSPSVADRLVATGLLEKVDDRRQMHAEDRWLLAKLYMASGLPEQATPQFEQAAKAGFSDSQFLTDFITHLIQMKELNSAWEKLERLSASFPSGDLTRLRARYLAAVGQSAIAVKELDEFADSGSTLATHAERLLLVAATCREILRSESAADVVAFSQATDRYLQATVEEDPKQVHHLIDWLLQQERDVEAFELLDVVWQQLPTETAANVSLNMLRAGSNHSRRDRVERLLAAKIQQEPQSQELKLCQAEVWSLGEKYSEAEELYREIIRADGRNVPALHSLAWQLAMRGRLLDDAMTFVERAISEAGPVAQLLDTRGCVKLAQSRLRAANDDLIAAAESNGTPATLLHLAFVQFESGDTVLAKRTMAHAVERGLRADRLHPLDRDRFEQLQTRFQSGRGPVETPGLEL
ncbi:MAG: VanZ family protein [Rhodopirellula sp.]|nr:VanZ family protein [Rhodopirellula sp.]